MSIRLAYNKKTASQNLTESCEADLELQMTIVSGLVSNLSSERLTNAEFCIDWKNCKRSNMLNLFSKSNTQHTRGRTITVSNRLWIIQPLESYY